MKKTVLLVLFSGMVAGNALCQGTGRLPSVIIRDVYGKNVKSSEIITPGKPAIISFWASWCRPCIRELSAISAFYKDWQEETGVILYAISVDDSRTQNLARIMMDSYSWNFKFYFDPNGDFSRSMGVVEIPHVFILNRKGEIIYQHVSYTEGSESEMIGKIREMNPP